MITKRNLQFTSILILVIVILTGCTPSATEAPTPVPPSPTVVIPTAAPTQTPVPTLTQIPAPTQTLFVPKATIKVVVHVPLSGDQSTAGTDLMRAAELATQQLAGPLNDMGYKIELVSFDDQASIDVAVVNAKEIVADEQILCGIGHYNSRVMINASDIYHVAGLAFVSPSNTAPKVTDRGYLEVNRLVGRDDGQGAAGARFAQAQGFTSVFVVRDVNDFANRNADAFKREATQLGLKIVGDFQANVQMGNYQAVAVHLLAADADMVYFSGFADQAGSFFKEARLAGYTGTLMGVDGSPSLVEAAGPLSIDEGGLYYTNPSGPISAYPDAATFVEDFQIKFGVSPYPYYAAEAYDAAGICMKAIEESTKAKGGELPTRKEVATAIRALKEYKGITGIYNFNKNGDPALARYFIFKVLSADPGNWGKNPVILVYKIPPPE